MKEFIMDEGINDIRIGRWSDLEQLLRLPGQVAGIAPNTLRGLAVENDRPLIYGRFYNTHVDSRDC
jgi:hypothetical protein